MARLITLTPNKTYVTSDNAVKAVEKVCPPDAKWGENLTYFIQRDESTGRYFPVFIGERAITAQMHFHFVVVA